MRNPSMIRSLLLTTLALSAATAHAAPASGPLSVTSSVMVEAKSRAADGTTRVTLVPARRVVPGDHVVFVLAYRNTGAQPIADIVFANPLPAGLSYRAPAQGSPAPDLSVDGATYGPLAQLRVATAGGATRGAAADDVTHLRWRLTRPLTAGAHGQFAYQAVVR
jgi:uncharacterized repeat protein (TIGR01451 family)